MLSLYDLGNKPRISGRARLKRRAQDEISPEGSSLFWDVNSRNRGEPLGGWTGEGRRVYLRMCYPGSVLYRTGPSEEPCRLCVTTAHPKHRSRDVHPPALIPVSQGLLRETVTRSDFHVCTWISRASYEVEAEHSQDGSLRKVRPGLTSWQLTALVWLKSKDGLRRCESTHVSRQHCGSKYTPLYVWVCMSWGWPPSALENQLCSSRPESLFGDIKLVVSTWWQRWGCLHCRNWQTV